MRVGSGSTLELAAMTFSAESFVYSSLFVCVLFEKRLERRSVQFR